MKASAVANVLGDDAEKRIVEPKRYIAVDTNGQLLVVNLTPADIADSTGALAVLAALRKRRPSMKHLFADGAYDRRALVEKTATIDFVVQVV